MTKSEWAHRARAIVSRSRTLGEALRLLRGGLGLTMREVAERVGCTAVFICDLEKGRKGTELLPEIARALQVPLGLLVPLRLRLSLEEWAKREGLSRRQAQKLLQTLRAPR